MHLFASKRDNGGMAQKSSLKPKMERQWLVAKICVGGIRCPTSFNVFRLPVNRQPETFAKPVTDGASAARRHLDTLVMRYLINVDGEPTFHVWVSTLRVALRYKNLYSLFS